MPAIGSRLQGQVALYLQACKKSCYRFEDLNKTLRNTLVQADFETTRMLILTQLANINHRSPSGKTALDHAKFYCHNPQDSCLSLCQRILDFVKNHASDQLLDCHAIHCASVLTFFKMI